MSFGDLPRTSASCKESTSYYQSQILNKSNAISLAYPGVGFAEDLSSGDVLRGPRETHGLKQRLQSTSSFALAHGHFSFLRCSLFLESDHSSCLEFGGEEFDEHGATFCVSKAFVDRSFH